MEETAYLMFHGYYSPVREVELIFWKYKSGVVLDDQTIYENYRLGKEESTALEAFAKKISGIRAYLIPFFAHDLWDFLFLLCHLL